MEFRLATEDDVPAITLIYNQGISDRVATLETELRSEEERDLWLRSRDKRHPVFVAVDNGQVAGWASLNRFNPRQAYQYVADFSVYVGRFLLSHLIEEARNLGFHKMVLAAFPWNEGGMRLYSKMGFRTVGVYKEQGRLDGNWVDTVIMEKLL